MLPRSSIPAATHPLAAGNDIILTSGQRTQSIDEASFSQSKGFGGLGGTKRSASAAFQLDRSDVIDNALAGQNVTLQSGRDIALEGGRFVAQDKLALSAGREISLESGRDLTLVAPQVKAETLTATAGGALMVAAATATHEVKETSEFKSNRLTPMPLSSAPCASP